MKNAGEFVKFYNSRKKWFFLVGVVLILGLAMLWLGEDGLTDPNSTIKPALHSQSGDVDLLSPNARKPEAGLSPDASHQFQIHRRIYGRVLDVHTRLGVPGAEVILLKLGGKEETRQELAIADAEGSFELWTEQSGWFQILARSDTGVSFQNKNRIQQFMIQPDTETLGPLTLELHQGVGLRLQVFSKQTGDPIPYAEAASHLSPKMVFEGNAKGEIAIIATAELWSFSVKAPLYERKLVSLDLGGGQEKDLKVFLDSAAAVYGVVRDQDGSPFEGVNIKVFGKSSERNAMTDSEGTYRIDHLPLGTSFSILGVHGGKTTMGKEFIFTKQEAIRRDLVFGAEGAEIHMGQRIGLVEGWVLEESGKPLENAIVWAKDSTWEGFEGKVQTDPKGFFSIKAPIQPMAGILIRAEKEGFSPKEALVPVNESAPGQVRIFLSESQFLEGYVRDEEGGPIGNAKILVYQPTLPGMVVGIHSESYTDDRGFFRLEQLSKGLSIDVSAEGFSTTRFEDIALNRRDTEFVLKARRSLRVKLVHKGTDQPFQEPFKLFIHDQNTFSIENFPELEALAAGVLFQSTKGEALIQGLPSGTTIKIVMESEEHALEKPVNHTVSQSNATDEPLLLEVVKKEGVVAGIAMTSEGRPLAQAEIDLSGISSTKIRPGMSSLLETHPLHVVFHQTVVTDQQGNFRFEKVPGGLELEIHGKKEGYSETILRLQPSDSASDRESVKVVLMKASRLILEVRVVSKAANDVIFLKGPSVKDRFFRLYQRDDPEILVEPLRPGTFEIKLYLFSKEDGSTRITKNFKVDLSEGEEQRVIIEDDETHTLSGQIWVGQEIGAHREVLLIPDRNDRVALATSHLLQKSRADAQGNVVFEEVVQGDYWIKLVPRHAFRREIFFASGVTGSNEVPITVSRDIHQAFHFDRHSTLTGRLVNGETVSHIWLESKNQEMADPEIVGVLNLDQSFYFLDVPPGRYLLRAVKGEDGESIILLVDLVVPENGEDVDLGDVDADAKGYMRVHFRAAVADQKMPNLDFMVYPAEMSLMDAISGGGRQFFWDPNRGPYQISGVPEGTYRMTLLGLNEGWITVPLIHEISVESGKVAELHVVMNQTSLLSVDLPDDWWGATAKMHNLTTGEVQSFRPMGTHPQSVYSGAEVFAIQTQTMLQARGFSFGHWRLTLESSAGNQFSREFQMQLGKPLVVKLTPEKQMAMGGK